MAGFCLAGISAAAIRGKKSPLKLGQQLQLRGAEVICLLVPPGACASWAAAEVPWLGQDVGTEPALPLCILGRAGTGAETSSPACHSPGGGRPRWRLSRDLAAWLEGRWGDAEQTTG